MIYYHGTIGTIGIIPMVFESKKIIPMVFDSYGFWPADRPAEKNWDFGNPLLREMHANSCVFMLES